MCGVAKDQKLTQLTLPMGTNFGDLDNDGFLDFYIGIGYPDYEALMPNVMYRKQGGTGFSDVTSAGGFGHLQKGHAIAFADLDHDGDQDVFEQIGGFQPGDNSLTPCSKTPASVIIGLPKPGFVPTARRSAHASALT